MKKTCFIFLTAAVLAAPNLSGAELSFQSSSPPLSLDSGIFDNLPQPVGEFINGMKDMGDSMSREIGGYVNTLPFKNIVGININPGDIGQLDPVQFLKDILQNSFVSGIYSFAIKILNLAGNLLIWILGLASDLIRQGLSVLN